MDTTSTDDGLLRVVIVVLAAIVLVPLVAMAVAMPMMGIMMGWGWQGGMVGGRAAPLWGLGLTLVWLAVLVGGGYLLYRGLVGRAGVGRARDPALAELRMAYARGDVSDEEYEERRERLQAGGAAGQGSSSGSRAGE